MSNADAWWWSVGFTVANVCVCGYTVWQLWRERREDEVRLNLVLESTKAVQAFNEKLIAAVEAQKARDAGK